MSNNGPESMELSPYFRERMLKSFIAIVGLVLGIIAVVGSLIIELNTMVKFAALFLGALFIIISLWRILRIATVKLYIDEEEIRYRDRFVWRRINWSEVISVGRENDVDEDTHQGRLSKIKSLLILTHDGLKQFDMSSYSLTHGIETVDKIMDSRSTEADEDESTEEE
ncbi:MAG: hypothetical protein KAJ76_09565 [Candidatus Heimdallarchaeota archaeon]|nr:hypothetical protein [Candidatus Heimdallarchaeota archaeon]